VLRDQPNYRYPIALIPAIARRYNTTAEKMKIVVSGYGLFEVDEEEFFSISLINRMDKMDKLRNQRVEAGKISAQKRLLLGASATVVERALNEIPTSVEQIKEKKVKEKKNKYGEYENVLLTDREHERLIADYGIDVFSKIIAFFSPYIVENKYKSESHNLAIRRWVVDAISKKQSFATTQNFVKELPEI
jgi:hypothetical protein